MTQPEKWDVLKILNWTRGYLAGKGVENPRLEAEWLLCEVLTLDRVGLYLNFDKPLSEAELALYRGLVARRGRREPLQYILGSQEFMGLDFQVSKAVLIPRHDTEVLVAAGVERGGTAASILEIGCGSGCVAIALARALPKVRICSCDISLEALEVARKNALRLEVEVEFSHGSLFEPYPGVRFDLILSNPPYIPCGELPQLEAELGFEPVGALDGGADGLDFYRAITRLAPEHLTRGGWLLFEVGAGQAPEVLRMLSVAGLGEDLFTSTDPAGIERVVGGRKA